MGCIKVFEIRHLFLILVVAVLSLAAWGGLYGFGVDWYYSYQHGNLYHRGGTFDRLGFILASATVSGTHIGILIVSSVMLLGIFQLFTQVLGGDKNYCILVLMMALAFHTWPVIMSTSNSMRQGLSMGFAYFAIAIFLNRGLCLKLLVFLILATLTHKISIVYFAIFAVVGLTSRLVKARSVVLLLLSLLYPGLYFALYLFGLGNVEGSRVIGGDFRNIILAASVLLQVFFFYAAYASKNRKKYILGLIAGSFQVTPIVFYSIGLNWEMERAFMYMVLFYIVAFASFFKPVQRIPVLCVGLTALLSVTIMAGMYDALQFEV